MGVTSSHLDDPQSNLQAQISTLFGQRQFAKVELIPTCDHDVRQSTLYHTNMPYGMVPVGGIADGTGFMPMMPTRRPRYDGGGGFIGSLGGIDMYQPQTICGHCRKMAHVGPCEGMARGGGGGRGCNRDLVWSRSRYMRGGDGGECGDENADLAAAINNMAEIWNKSQNENTRGCGPACSANDGSIHLRGRAFGDDVDLRLGGKVKCPCAEHGGCDATKWKAQSRSRSRRRKERRGLRMSQRRESNEMEASRQSSDEEHSRGRRRKRQTSRQASLDKDREQPPQSLKEQLRMVVEDNKALMDAIGDLESRLCNRAGPVQTEIEPPLTRPYVMPDYGSQPRPKLRPTVGGPAYGDLSHEGMLPRRRPWTHHPMEEEYRPGLGIGMGVGDTNTPPPAYGFGSRMNRPSPLDPRMDLGVSRYRRGYPLDASLDQGVFGLDADPGLGLDGRRQRQRTGRMDTVGLDAGMDDWNDLDDPLQAQLPSRPLGGLGGLGLRAGRGSKFRSLGPMNRRAQVGRTRPRPELFASGAHGLADLGEEEELEEEDNLFEAQSAFADSDVNAGQRSPKNAKEKAATAESARGSSVPEPEKGLSKEPLRSSKRRDRPVGPKAGLCS